MSLNWSFAFHRNIANESAVTCFVLGPAERDREAERWRDSWETMRQRNIERQKES